MNKIRARKACWIALIETWFLPEDILQKIHFIILEDELQSRFFSGLTMYSLTEADDMKGCHPGRFTLDPEAYRKRLPDNWRSRRGGKYHCGPKERLVSSHGYDNKMNPGGNILMQRDIYLQAFQRHKVRQFASPKFHYIGVHRKLTDSMARYRYIDEGKPQVGIGNGTYLQDIYFLAGMPLTFWSSDGEMGLNLPDGDSGYASIQWYDKESIQERFTKIPDLKDRTSFWGRIDIFDEEGENTYMKYLQREEQKMIDL